MAIDFGGPNWKVEVGEADGTGFQELAGISNMEPDNSSDEITRNFLNGESLVLQKNFTTKVNLTLTDIGSTNLDKIVHGYVYASGAAIDGVDGVTAGTGGVAQIGVQKGTSTQVAGIVRFVPLSSAQATHTVYLLDAICTLVDYTMEDGLLEMVVSISGKAVVGQLTFA